MNWWNNGKMWDLTNNHDDVVRGSRILDRPSKGTISPLICLNPLRLRNPLRERLFDFASLSISKTVSVSYNFLWVPPPRNLGGDPTKFRVSMCQDWRTVNPAVQIPGIRRVFFPGVFYWRPRFPKTRPAVLLGSYRMWDCTSIGQPLEHGVLVGFSLNNLLKVPNQTGARFFLGQCSMGPKMGDGRKHWFGDVWGVLYRIPCLRKRSNHPIWLVLSESKVVENSPGLVWWYSK